MITIGDMSAILSEDLASFDIPIYRDGEMPVGAVTNERIVIVPEELKPETYWSKTFIEVRFYVPDIMSGDVRKADALRLTELEREAAVLESVSEYDGSVYRYSVSSISQKSDVDLSCHLACVRLLFEVLNVN